MTFPGSGARGRREAEQQIAWDCLWGNECSKSSWDEKLQRKKYAYIKISAVDTMWSWLGKCEWSAKLAEETNRDTDKRGIKSLNTGVILCLMVLTRSFAMSSKMTDDLSRLYRAAHMGFLSTSHTHQVLQRLVILINLPWSGFHGALWWFRGRLMHPLECFTDSSEIKCLEQECCQGCCWGLQIPTFSGRWFLASVLVPVLWGTSGSAQQTPAIRSIFSLQAVHGSPGLLCGFPLQGCIS